MQHSINLMRYFFSLIIRKALRKPIRGFFASFINSTMFTGLGERVGFEKIFSYREGIPVVVKVKILFVKF